MSSETTASTIRRRIVPLYEDFRASVHPDTAASRLEHFKAVLAGIEADDVRRELDGAEPWRGRVRTDHKWLVEAHIRFAKSQLEEIATRETPQKVPASAEEAGLTGVQTAQVSAIVATALAAAGAGNAVAPSTVTVDADGNITGVSAPGERTPAQAPREGARP